MRCPTLNELPPPPPGRTGWPWTEESPQLPDTMPDGTPWPRVSIVTPSYNQAQFIEETIRSVLLQGYPDLEYIIIDGGSTDGSVEIIRKYAPWLAYWVSEPDRGQSHAINKGFERATGEIVAWLNSDDVYQREAFRIVGNSFRFDPNLVVLYSECNFIDEWSRIIGQSSFGLYDRSKLILRNCIPQPTTFIRLSNLLKIGFLDESLHYSMDYDIWLKLCLLGDFIYIGNQILANFRRHNLSKSNSRTAYFWPEVVQSYEKLFTRDDLPLDIVSLRERAIREAAWRAATAFYRVGMISQAREYALLAAQKNLLEKDHLIFAAQHLLYDEARSATKHDLSNFHWILEVLTDLRSIGLKVDRLQQLTIQNYLEANAFLAHSKNLHRKTIRFILKALKHDRRAWSNRGLWRILVESLVRSLMPPFT